MMLSYIHKAGITAIIAVLLLTGTGYSAESKTPDANQKKESSTAAGSEKKDENALQFGLMDGMQKIVREERIQTLSEIDRERKATLAYLTEEREAVIEELRRTTDILLKERRVTMVEMEIMGNRIVENTMSQSKELIDHFFIRTLQLIGVMVVGFCFIGFVYYLIRYRRKVRASNA